MSLEAEMFLTDLSSSTGSSNVWHGVQTSDYGVREEQEGNSAYEVPEVREVSNCAPLSPSLLLITAPASVGKSTAAAFMSNELRAPILDLSSLQVGTGTLEGALAKSFGIRRNAEFQESLMESKATLIIDALDEAEVRSGQTNFQAFVRGVADTASQVTGERAAIVVFSRAESARPLQDIFNERGIQYSHFEICAFGEAQARRYLERKMTDIYAVNGKEPRHLKHIKPFEKAREDLFAALASAITQNLSNVWDDPDVRDFLGYAPVLDVAAEFLAVDNFSSLAKTIDSGQRAGIAHWDLVASVINHLLLREQDKFVQQFKMTPGFRQNGTLATLSILYSPEEQCARLLDHVEHMGLDLDIPAALPDRLRDDYETAVKTQLSNHPFLRGDGWFNVIFRDYVTARSLGSAFTSGKSATAIRKGVLSVAWKHSPMYAFFSHSLGKASTGEISSCHSEDLGALYESFKSMCEADDRLELNIGKVGNRLDCSFAIVRGKSQETFGPLKFVTYEGTTSVSFSRELSNVSIWGVPELILGGDHPSFKFGPDVLIMCGDLLLSSSEVQAYKNTADGLVLLNVKSLTSDSSKIQADASSFFIICDDELPFPWSRYQKRINVGGIAADARESRALYLEFRRIVLRFKDAKRGEAAVYQPMMDNLVVGANKRARAVLDYLQEIGCIKLANSMYLLDLGVFGELGISRSQLRDLEENPAAGRVSRDLLAFFKRG